MKYLITISFLFLFFAGFSQIRVLTGLHPSTGRPGYIYRDTLRSLNLRSPLYSLNDSTIAINDTISTFTKNGTGDSIILTLANGQRFAALDVAGAGGGTAAGSTGHVQFNYGGSFAASPNLFYDSVNKRLGIGTAAPAYLLDAVQSTNGAIRIAVTNVNIGTTANAILQATSNGGSIQMGMLGTGFTTSGLQTAGTAFLQNNGGSKLIFKTIASGTYLTPPIVFAKNNGSDIEQWRIDFLSGNLSNTLAAGTAAIHLKASTGAAGTAPIKISVGTVLAAVEDGALEYLGSNVYFSVGSTRYIFAKTSTALATLDFGSTAAGTSSALTVAVAGAADGDVVSVGAPNASHNANSAFTAYVSAAGTVTVKFNNYSAAPIDPASGTFRVSVIRY